MFISGKHISLYHCNCRFAYTPKSRTDFWLKKLEANAIRDLKVASELESSGWRVITVWECELRTPDHLAARMNDILRQSN